MDVRWLVLAKPSLPQVNTLKSALEDMEKERDYYFGKLREVELLCQEQDKENAKLVGQLMMILYAADEQVGPRVELDWWGGGGVGGGGGRGWEGVRRCGYVMCGPTRERPLYLC